MSAATQFAAGFADPVLDSQAIFKVLLSAMAEPGSVRACPQRLDVTPLNPVMTAIALTVMDFETPYTLIGYDQPDSATQYFSFHTGAPLAASLSEAHFAFVADAAALPSLDAFSLGQQEYPERSVTLVIEAGRFGDGARVEFSGPGLAAPVRFSASGLGTAFWRLAEANAALYPLGADFVFCGDGALAALPRSTRIRIVE